MITAQPRTLPSAGPSSMTLGGGGSGIFPPPSVVVQPMTTMPTGNGGGTNGHQNNAMLLNRSSRASINSRISRQSSFGSSIAHLWLIGENCKNSQINEWIWNKIWERVPFQYKHRDVLILIDFEWLFYPQQYILEITYYLAFIHKMLFFFSSSPVQPFFGHFFTELDELVNAPSPSKKCQLFQQIHLTNNW
jgi:hypothetical protein